MPGKSLKLRPIAAAPSSTDVRKKKKRSTDPRSISSIVDDPAGTSGELAPTERLATLKPLKKREPLATFTDLREPVDRLQAALNGKKKRKP